MAGQIRAGNDRTIFALRDARINAQIVMAKDIKIIRSRKKPIIWLQLNY